MVSAVSFCEVETAKLFTSLVKLSWNREWHDNGKVKLEEEKDVLAVKE